MKLVFWATMLFAACEALVAGDGQESARRMEARRAAVRAATATQQRDFARAEEEWRKVIALDPHSAQAYHNLGMVYYLEHKYPEAEEALTKALRLDSSLVNAQVLLGASLGRQGKLARASVELEQALKARLSDSAEKTARVALHEIWYARENYVGALEVLKPLAEKYPRDVDVLYNLGQTYLQLSAQSFQQIVLVDPHSYRLQQVLAESLARQGHYRDAIREYRQALEQQPQLPGVHYQIGLLYWLNEATSEGENAARQEFEAELKINPYDAWSEYRLGQIYWKRRESESAVAHFRRALQLDEDLVPPRIALARSLETQGNFEEAQKLLEVAEKLEPGNATVQYRLARLYKQRGQVAAAAEHLGKFEELQSERRKVQRELEKVLGSIAEPGMGSLDEPDR